MVETGTSATTPRSARRPRSRCCKQVCRLIAADEYRHFKLFYDHMKRYLGAGGPVLPAAAAVAAGRIGESEDDELAFAFHCANEDPGVPYNHDRCIAGYMGRAMGFYRFRHIERGMGMIFKSIGLQPRGRLSALAARGAWRFLDRRRDKFRRASGRPGSLAA